MSTESRIRCPKLSKRIMSARDAASLIPSGVNVGMSGFTGAGYPKAVPQALAEHIRDHRARGENFRISVWTGASTAPELDGALAEVDGIEMRLPYQSDPTSARRSTKARWNTWISTCRTWPSTHGPVSSASWILLSSRWWALRKMAG